MRSILAVFVLVSTAMPSTPIAFASGTSGGGYGSGNGGVSYPSPQRDPAAIAYSRGKSMLKKHIACKKCAFPGGVGDTPTAQKVAARIRAGEFQLKPVDRDQVLYYLSQRFGA